MAEIIRMPRMSDTMEEGVIASWLKKVGDEVKPGDVLAEVETDKATMELEAYEEGTLLHIGVKEKETVAVNGVIAILGKKGENIESLLKEIKSGGSTSSKKETSPETEKEDNTPKAEETSESIDTSGIKASLITMPRMSDTMTEGTIANWLKKEGDEVKSGDIIAEVETDKATMELEAYEDGTLLYIGIKEGDSVPVDGILAVVGEKGADFKTLIKAHKAPTKEASKEENKETTDKESSSPETKGDQKGSTQPTHTSSTNGRVKASPLAKKLADEKGYDLGQIPGSGEGGRIVKRDIENFSPSISQQVAAGGSAAPVGQEGHEDIAASQMRKAIVKGLTNSQFGAPHFYLTMEIDMDKTIEARKSINEVAPEKISFNDIIIKAAAAALRKHPEVNTSWISDSNTIRRHQHIHVGVAMAIEDGLVVPVVKFADGKSLSQISSEVKVFSGKAKNKKLSLDEMQGNTFTVSNLGMFGIEAFTSIINAPESCILAVGAIKETPVVKNGQIVPGNIMKVTMTCDHRTVDGAVGAAFLVTLKNLLEDPVRILV